MATNWLATPTSPVLTNQTLHCGMTSFQDVLRREKEVSIFKTRINSKMKLAKTKKPSKANNSKRANQTVLTDPNVNVYNKMNGRFSWWT